MENEIMNYEDDIMETEVEFDEANNERTGISTGTAVLIGAGVTAAAVAAVTLGKKAWAWIKAKKELRKHDEHDFVEVSDEEIKNVTK